MALFSFWILLLFYDTTRFYTIGRFGGRATQFVYFTRPTFAVNLVDLQATTTATPSFVMFVAATVDGRR